MRSIKYEYQNLISLGLRYLNIWLIVGLPLLIKKNEINESLFYIGIGGFLFLFIGIFFKKIGNIFVENYYLSIWATVLFLITSSIFLLKEIENTYLFIITALTIGYATANCEIKCLYMAVNRGNINKKSKNLKTFNSLKVFGIAAGFFFAALLYDKGISTHISLIITILILILILSLKESFNEKQSNLDIKNFSYSDISFNKIIAIIFFILDVSLFSFWYIFLPSKMIEANFNSFDIAIFLTAQAIFHAGFQFFWANVVRKIGSITSFLVSYGLHLVIIFVISSFVDSFIIGIILFSLMGLVNSGTFLASSLLFYKKDKNYIGDNYIHLMASNFGKFFGVFLWNI